MNAGGMPSTNIHINIDATQRSPLRRIWHFVGYDEPNYTYTENGKELLAKLGAMADGPYFIRCHFLLCTGDGTGRLKWGSTNVYTEDSKGNPVYDWEIIDRIFDTYLESGCVPFVEIGFMPLALTSAPEDVQYDAIRDAGWGYPPRDYSRWADLVRALARHCLERYGLREVSRWYWELWNEPDIFYWHGTTGEYCRLFDYTEAALHSVIPQAKLGGPAVTSPGRPEGAGVLRDFLAHCAHGENSATGGRGTRLDYITFHTKGARYTTDHAAVKQTPSIETLVSHVSAGLAVIDEYPEFAALEVNLSECDPDGWAAGGIHDNPNLEFRNTEYYASFLADAVCKLVDFRVDGMVTWAFEFEGKEYFEGLRCLSTNGIDKPVLNVFRMLARLGGARLGVTSGNKAGCEAPGSGFDVSAVAAEDQAGTVRLFAVAHHDDWDASGSVDVKVALSGLEPRRDYSVRSYRLNREEGNSYTAWKAMGGPQSPTGKQLEGLREAARLQPREEKDLASDGSGKTGFTFTLEGHSVVLFELTPIIEG